MIEDPITLVTDEGEIILQTGAIAEFPVGEANGHHLINNCDRRFLSRLLCNRTPGDQVTYPDADLSAKFTEEGWQFEKK